MITFMNSPIVQHIPNAISFARIVLGLAGAGLLLLSSQSESEGAARVFAIASFICLLIGALSDWLDGWSARQLGVESPFGAFIDPLADKVLANAYLVSFLVITHFDVWLLIPVLIIVTRDVVVTLLRLLSGESKPVAVSFDAKMKTAFLFLLILMPFIFIISGLINLEVWYPYWLGGIWFITILSIWTGFKYFR